MVIGPDARSTAVIRSSGAIPATVAVPHAIISAISPRRTLRKVDIDTPRAAGRVETAANTPAIIRPTGEAT